MLKANKKKILAMIVLFLTIFNMVQPIFAANQVISGSEKFMARQYATRLRTTDEGSNGDNGIIARRLILRNAGWQFGNGDGIIVFCAQNKTPFATRNRL